MPRRDERSPASPTHAPDGGGRPGGSDAGQVQRWPASATQRWFLQAARTTEIDEPALVMSIVLRIRGPLDVDRLDRAYDELVARQEVLRTRLVREDGAAWQRVEPHRPVALRRHDRPVADDGNHEDDGDDEATVIDQWTTWRIPFGVVPAVQGFVAERAPDHHLLGLIFQHTAVDPTSLVVASRDLAAIYTARRAGRPPDPLPMSHGEYAAWQQRRLAPRLADDRRAWMAAFAGLRPPRYRRDHPFVPGRPAVGSELRAPLLTADELQQVERWSWRHRSTTLCTLLAAFARTCARWTDDRDLPIATVFEQRDHPEAGGIVGPFIHGALLRVAVEDDEPWPHFVARVREVVTATYPRAHVPLVEQVVRAPSLIPGTTGRAPSWSRSFHYIPTPDTAPAFRFGEATGQVIRTGGPLPSTLDHGLHLWARPVADGRLVGHLLYDATELTPASARSLLTDWTATIRDLLAAP